MHSLDKYYGFGCFIINTVLHWRKLGTRFVVVELHMAHKDLIFRLVGLPMS